MDLYSVGTANIISAMRRKGKIADKRPQIWAFAGDGGTADIGLQSLSGALERTTAPAAPVAVVRTDLEPTLASPPEPVAGSPRRGLGRRDSVGDAEKGIVDLIGDERRNTAGAHIVQRPAFEQRREDPTVSIGGKCEAVGSFAQDAATLAINGRQRLIRGHQRSFSSRYCCGCRTDSSLAAGTTACNGARSISGTVTCIPHKDFSSATPVR